MAGHASNSISAALGMSTAFEIAGEKGRHVVAVIGDGAMTGGPAFEGINNASIDPNNLLIVLNDNDMSIDRNVGGINRYLVDITTSQAYNRIRYEIYQKLRKLNIISEDRRENILRFNNSLKALINRQHNLFEGFSIRYFGPIDGHDVQDLVQKLTDIKDMKGPKLLHIKTKKGKGYKPAEQSATAWHAPGRFDKDTGRRLLPERTNEPQLYQDVFGHTLVELAEKDRRITGVTPAMPTGCSMTYMMKAFPDRAFDVGIAEGHAVTFSAGMAKEGMIPFCNIYSSFMQRAYDQVIHDAAILTIGSIGNEAHKAILAAAAEGISVAHYDMIYLKPIDEALLHEVGQKHSRIITVENGTIVGGLGTAVMELMMEHGYTPRVHRIGIPDCFIQHGSIADLYKLCGMDAAHILSAIHTLVGRTEEGHVEKGGEA